MCMKELWHYFPLVIGWASSSMRDDALAFLAASLTVNASGLNWTWSMVSRMIGVASSLSLQQRSKVWPKNREALISPVTGHGSPGSTADSPLHVAARLVVVN